MNNFEILQIPNHSDIKVIKKAYKKLVILYHPDKTGNDPGKTKKFLKIQAAYDDLLNGKTGINNFYSSENISTKENGRYAVDNIQKWSSGRYAIAVRLTNIKIVRVSNIGNYTVDKKIYNGNLMLDEKDVKKENYKIVLTFYDYNGNSATVSYKIKDDRNFFTKIIDKYF